MSDDSATRFRTVTPVGAVARGLLAGALGTAAMDAFLFARYRRLATATTLRLLSR